ncbi:hypothetical protein ABT065_12400 [Streptomyces sp. NPDC002764]|uniref:hypothetical protein n=1 Tax=Streptomyces sp. NPDC002764 TaxID=3154428 RepID=UPI00331EECAC
MATPRNFRHIALGAMVLPLAMLAPTSGRTATETAAADTAVQGRDGNPASTVDHVADFYGAYTDVLHDVGHGRLSDALRGHYLTPELRRALARWEAAHHRDGVLRAKGVPTQWRVEYNDSGMGHCWTRVTLTWNDPGKHKRTSHVMIQSDLATRLISGIRADE